MEREKETDAKINSSRTTYSCVFAVPVVPGAGLNDSYHPDVQILWTCSLRVTSCSGKKTCWSGLSQF